MKLKHFLPILSCLIFSNTNTHAQQNNTLRGKVLYLNSNKQPATGVKIAGTVKEMEHANEQYTTSNGSFELVFPAERDGHQVNLEIGAEDELGQAIEVVNDKEVDICRIPAIASDEFEIIVCPKGARDTVAQRYYQIIKSSSDVALAEKKKEFNNLLNAQQKDYEQIAALSEQISQLEKKADSVAIYRTAWRIASINKDNANKRVLKYQSALDQGKTVQQALEHLSIADASKQADKATNTFNEAIEELELCAEGSMSVFDYNSAIACYDSIIIKMEVMHVNSLAIAGYYDWTLQAALGGGQYDKALEAGNKAINIREAILDPNHPDLATSYNNKSAIYQSLGRFDKALEFQEKSTKILVKIECPELAAAYNNTATIYQFLGKYEEALEIQKKAIEIQKKILDPKHPNMASIYGNIGNSYQLLDQYAMALANHKKSTKIREEILDPKHPLLASSYGNISNTYESLRQFEKALEFQKKSVEISAEVLAPKHPILAASYNGLGKIYHSSGQFGKALEFQKKAVAIREDVLKPKHPDLAISYGHIGNTYYSLGQFEKALEFHKKTIEIQEEIFDKEHPRLATSYGYIGLTYRSLGNFKKALEYQKKDIEIRKRNSDSKHPYLAFSYGNVGNTYHSLGQFEKALEFGKKALNILEEILDPIHPDLATAYLSIGDNYHSLGQFEIALKYQKKAIRIREETLDAYHPDLATSLNSVAMTYQSLRQFEKALEFHKRAIEIREEIYGSKHPALAASYGNIGCTFDLMGQFEKALEFQKKAIKILKEVLDQNHPNLAISFSNISVIHQSLGQFEKALNFQKKAIKIQEEILDSNHPSLINSFNNIAVTYRLIGQFENALDFQQKSIKIANNALPKKHPYQQNGIANLLKIYIVRAFNNFRKKDFTKALIDFETANEYQQTGSNWNYSGLCFYYLKDYSKAIEAYQKAASLDSTIKTKHFYNNIGTAYAKNKQFKKAFEAFTAYEKLFPKEGRPFRNWAMYYALKNEKDKALTHLQKAIALGFDDLEWLKTDDSMDGLRKEPAFIELLKQLEKSNTETQKNK